MCTGCYSAALHAVCNGVGGVAGARRHDVDTNVSVLQHAGVCVCVCE